MSEYADKNELYHWMKGAESANHKYISRYFKDGKWRYIYNNKSSSDGRTKDTRSFKERFKDWMGYDERERMTKAAVKAGSSYENNKKKRKKTGEIDRDTKAKTRAYQKARDEYNKTPLGKIDKAKENVKKKVQKAHDWIDKKVTQRQRKRASKRIKVKHLG